ncbi:MAG: hypothetical protein H6815_10775 [Phycisphaeraceae bacterium]|nr:hypothetical protein [Phycisphaerales bacterium]MCB9860919.1 hypothetical protein [Phycisphaeraceae bacterium]
MPSIQKLLRITVFMLLIVIAAHARAQDGSEPAQPDPTPEVTLPGEQPVYELPKLLPEGTFVPARLGRVVTIATGERLIIFARDASGTTPRPMILLPSPGFDVILETMNEQDTLARQSGAATSSARHHLFVCSGRVYVYHDWNYLLPSTARPATLDDIGSPQLTNQDESSSDLDNIASPPNVLDPDELDPSVDSLIKELEQAQRGPRALATDPSSSDTSGSTSSSTETTAMRTYTKDRSLLRRTGRVGRVSGAWTFMLDNSGNISEAPSLYDQPIPILPCQALESIEKVVGQYGTTIKLEVTGLVVHTHHRPMLLPSFFQIVETNELRPLQ